MRRIWIVLLLLTAAAGCSVGPEIVTPDVAMASSWIEPTVSSSAPPVVAWWTTLEDPTLTSYVERAVAFNHDIRIAVARVREAKALRRATAGGHYPDIAAGGGAARLRGSENGFGPGPALVREGFGSLEDNLFNLQLDASCLARYRRQHLLRRQRRHDFRASRLGRRKHEPNVVRVSVHAG